MTAPRYVPAEEVARLLTYEACIPLMRDAMMALSAGRTRQLLRGIIDLPEGRAFGVMPGAMLDELTFGAKLVSVYPENFAKAKARTKASWRCSTPPPGRFRRSSRRARSPRSAPPPPRPRRPMSSPAPTPRASPSSAMASRPSATSRRSAASARSSASRSGGARSTGRGRSRNGWAAPPATRRLKQSRAPTSSAR